MKHLVTKLIVLLTRSTAMDRICTFQKYYVYSVEYYYSVLMNIMGGGNGTPLQYSCLENPMDGGAW